MRNKWLINIALGAGLSLVLVLLLFLWFRFHTRHGEKIEVPNVKGQTLEKAVEVLEENDLRFEVSDTIYDASLKPGAVAEQNPVAGSGVKPDRIIYLKVNALGKPTVAMPNLVDKSFTLAKALLRSKGLELGQVTMKFDEFSNNLVIEQFYLGRSVAPNTRLEKGAVIDLWVTTSRMAAPVDSLGTDSIAPPTFDDNF